MAKKPTTQLSIRAYIAAAPKAARAHLKTLYAIVKKAAPQAEEAMSYGMPTFKLNGNLVHFAAHTEHVGFYPAPSAIEEFRTEIEKYKSSKGAIQFPLDRAIPTQLIKRIVKFRLKENLEKPKRKPTR